MTQMLNVQELRRELESELDQLLEKLEQSTGSNKRTASNPDRADLAQQYTQRERQIALHDIEEERLTQIQEALQRIEDGTYGNCTNCGEAIEPGRLLIIPYTTLCVRCRQEQEQRIG